MKKILTLLTLLLGVGSAAWADTETVTLLSYTVTSESTNGSDLTAGDGTIKFGAEKFEARSVSSSGYGYKMDGDNGSKYALLTVATELAVGDKIVITGSQSSSNTTGYKFTDDTTPTTTYGTLAVAANKNEQTNTYTIPTGSGLIGKNSFYIFRNTNSIYLHKVEITREVEVTDNRSAVTLSFSSSTANASLGTSFSAPTLIVDPVAAASEVVYSSSIPGVAEVNASTGAVTIKAAGETTITAAISGSTTYKDASASYTLTVTDPSAINISATWAMADGAESTGVAGADNTVMKMAWNLGSNMNIDATATGAYPTKSGTLAENKLTLTRFIPSTKVTDKTEGHYVEWSMTPWKGLTFTPEQVSLVGYKCGTGSGNITVVLIDGTGKEITVKAGQELVRDNANTTNDAATYTYPVTGAAASANAVKLRVYIYNIDAGNKKQAALGNVVITGSASGTAEELTSYIVTTSMNIEGAGTISPLLGENSVYEGNDIQLNATANTGYKFLNWTIDGTTQTANPYTISNINENHTAVANFKQLLSITYAAGEGEGEVPATAYADEGDSYTVAKSYFLKKDGYTLTGWFDGTNTYTAGQTLTMPANNVTLTAVFAENTESLNKTLSKTTVTWDFQQKNIGVFTSAYPGWFVAQATINSKTIDVPMAFDKQIPNGAWQDWANTGNKPTLTIPAISGMKITMLTYNSPSATTIAGADATDYTVAGSNNPYTVTYTYNGSDATIDIVLEDAGYIRTLTVEYPKTHTYVDVTEVGYRTFASKSALDFTTGVEGLTAYRATVDNKKVSFIPIDGPVPAEEGMLIKAEEGRYYIPLATGTPAEIENEFIGVTSKTTVEGAGIFVLMNINDVVGFYKTTAESFEVGANTAYLPANVVSSARSFISIDGDETTGIAEVEGIAVEQQQVYDLQGRRVAQPVNGLYIVNGKKMVIK